MHYTYAINNYIFKSREKITSTAGRDLPPDTLPKVSKVNFKRLSLCRLHTYVSYIAGPTHATAELF